MLSASKSGSGLATGYNLTRSLRFRRSATAYLNRTPSVAGNRQKFTISVWYKAGGISASEVNANILNAGGDGSSVLISGTGAFGGTYQDRLLYREGGTTLLYWPMVFRDPASWYHIVFAMDTTQATAANRTKLYVNGVDQGAFSGTAITQNASTSINNTSAHYINTYNGTFYPSDLYYTEYNFIDGQALTPSSFGSTNTLTGVWQPARYTGSYGTNGFYLPFTDNSALTTASNVGLGKDFSGNANYWVTNNISITAGVTYDSMTDVPTLTSATAANFAVLNPLSKGSTITVQAANLQTTIGTVHNGVLGSIQLPTSGKWYWEVVIGTTTGSNNVASFGVATAAASMNTYDYNTTGTYSLYLSTNFQLIINGSTGSAFGSSTSSGTVCGVAYDANNGQIYLAVSNTYYNSAGSGTGNPAGGTNSSMAVAASLGLFPYIHLYDATVNINFGQRPFTYTAPTGFVALNTFNLPTSTIVKGNTVMDATLWAGNSSTQSIVNAAAFKTDFVWIKNRTGANNHALFDSVRGATKRLYSDATLDEQTEATTLTAFNSNGFSLSSSGAVNLSANNYVGWQWQAGQGTTSSNTNGTITSTVSVNASAGFSVVTWTGTGANATVGHGLGVAPQLIINKPRNAVDNWISWHTSLGSTGYIYLNLTNASATAATVWNSTLPTSSVFSVGTSSNINTSAQTMVSYCWTPIAGFSAFGSYTGNGSTDGPFVYTGFRPKFVLIKSTSNAENWHLHDTSRDTYNLAIADLYADSSGAEVTTFNQIDILSNGFKLRSTNSGTNGSGYSFIYMAFAENPFKNALAR